MVGKTTDRNLAALIDEYTNRLKFYLKLEVIVIPELKNTKNLTFEQQKELEGNLILSKIENADEVILLDEHGKQFSSIDFADFISRKLNSVNKCMIFVVGGPYGFSKKIYQRADGQISLSKMTFSHQMIRLLFAEQLYRAMTIIKGESYHHE